MSLPWITLTSSLSEGIKCINSIDHAKFPLLLSRIYNAQNVDQPFSHEELQKLEKSLNVQHEDLRTMIDTLVTIIKRSHSVLMKPTVLQEELTQKLYFHTNKTETFVQFWTENTKRDFDDIQNRKKLQNILWELNLQTASDTDVKQTIPTSLIQLEVKNSDDKLENITFEMNEEQLLEMYNQVESIQNYLDSINK
ncbi:Valette [Carabus blaptoides fortunei]